MKMDWQLTCLIETDEGGETFLMKLAWGNYRTCLSYQTYIVSLCQPSGWQWDRVVFLSHFLLVCWVSLHSVAQIFGFRASRLSHMKTGPQPQSLSHQLCSFIMWIFSSILPFVLLNDKLQRTSKGWIPVFEFWKGVYCRCCLLRSLLSHYPLGCIFLLTLEQLGSRRDLWEFG